MILIREIRENDAAAFLDLKKRLDSETSFMMLEPGERQTSVEQTREQIRSLLTTGNQAVLVAEVAGKLAGYLSASGGAFRRNRHTAYVVIGVLQAYAGQGIGTQLFLELDEWAREHGVHRLELTVMAHNQRGIRLYKRSGFEIEGLRKHSLRVDGQWVDEYAMAKLVE